VISTTVVLDDEYLLDGPFKLSYQRNNLTTEVTGIFLKSQLHGVYHEANNKSMYDMTAKYMTYFEDYGYILKGQHVVAINYNSYYFMSTVVTIIMITLTCIIYI
jgi:hypothetical protein